MNIQLKTKVDGNYKSIMQQFDRKLFEALKPKNAKMKIVEFTGSKKGDLVHLQFLSRFLIFTYFVSVLLFFKNGNPNIHFEYLGFQF